MRKVEFQSYAIVGSGRLARHLHFYLSSLNLPLRMWSRDGDPTFNSELKILESGERLRAVVNNATHVLFAVKDGAIDELSRPWRDGDKRLVHFSGALQVPGVCAAHPLMTFGRTLEDLAWYRDIPFVLDEGVALADVLPGLDNPAWGISARQRPLYHALCSLAGNSTFLLWQKIGDEFEKTLGLPRRLLTPFLTQVVANSGEPSLQNFTGPVARGDWATVTRHLEALANRPELLKAYRGFLELANTTGHMVPEGLL